MVMIPLNTPSEMIAISVHKAVWTTELCSAPVIANSTLTDDRSKKYPYRLIRCNRTRGRCWRFCAMTAVGSLP